MTTLPAFLRLPYEFFKRVLWFLILLCVFSGFASAQQTVDLSKIYGVTIDNVEGISNITKSLRMHCKKMTARIVFDEFVPAADYAEAVDSISAVAFIMGELLDSYYVNQYSLAQYTARTKEYLDAFQNKVDIWEVGNEINGEWVGSASSVKAKMKAAYDEVKARGKKAELTLYYNKNCDAPAANEMFTWAKNNVPADMKAGLDYVLISYYEDDCYDLQPNWQVIFDSLHAMFPNSKIGMGECGTDDTITPNKKADFINRYYSMNITTPNYIGGYFWWYYYQDCVPYNKPKSRWTDINNKLECISTYSPETNHNDMTLYPNPSDGQFLFSNNSQQKSVIEIHNSVGQLIEKIETSGSSNFGGNYAPGVYWVKVQQNNQLTYSYKILKL